MFLKDVDDCVNKCKQGETNTNYSMFMKTAM